MSALTATGCYCSARTCYCGPVAAIFSGGVHEGPPTRAWQRLGDPDKRRHRPQDQSPEVPDPHLLWLRARDRGGARLLRRRGVGRRPGAQDTSVGDLICDWRALVSRELSPTTVCRYEWIVANHITPICGRVPLARPRTAQLGRLLRAVAGRRRPGRQAAGRGDRPSRRD